MARHIRSVKNQKTAPCPIISAPYKGKGKGQCKGKGRLEYAILGLFILLNSFMPLRAQLSQESRITILTCSPGEELYSIFGHTAMRVVDPVLEIDYVFNYGTFDFNTPNFYLKFMRGQLDYALSVSDFSYFLPEYRQAGQSVIEQSLNLTTDEKNRLFKALISNYEPQNRYYKYHFFFDNCATRVRDVIASNIGDTIVFPEKEYKDLISFRDAIGTYLHNRPWTKLGLDLILGAPTDDPVNASSIQFLPDYLMLQFSDAHRAESNTALIHSTETLLESKQPETAKPAPPVVWLSLLALAVLVYSYISYRKRKSSMWLNSLIFSLIGILGLLIIFLWFFTSHTVTGPNWHIIWANPLYLILLIPSFSNSRAGTLIRQLMVLAIFLFAILSAFMPQYIPGALIPVWIILIVRLIFFDTRKKLTLNKGIV